MPSSLHLRHHHLEFPIFILSFLVLSQDSWSLFEVKVVIIHLSQRIAFVRGVRLYVLLYPFSHTAVCLQRTRVYWLLRLSTGRNTKFHCRVQERLGVKLTWTIVARVFVNRVLKLGLSTEHTLFVLF